jgi:hypothetical protein
MDHLRNAVSREPLVLFGIIGMLLYAAIRAVQPEADTETIAVPAETLRALIKQQEETQGRDLTADEIHSLVDAHIDDEVLLREARRRNLAHDESSIRQQVLTNMRASLDEPIAEPTVAELQAFYRADPSRQQTEATINLEQVAFPWGSEKLPQDPAEFLDLLKDHPKPSRLGESSRGGSRIQRADRATLIRLFGSDFTHTIVTLPLRVWNGPIQSKIGTHYVRVTERHAPQPIPFELIATYLRQQWEIERRHKTQQEKIQRMRQRYRIELPNEYRREAPQK